MGEAKYCVECKHYFKDASVWPEGHACRVKEIRNLVTGKIESKSCSTMRGFYEAAGWPICGPEGLLWESL